MPLTMQEKTDFFFNYKICNFLSFFEILIDIWLICLYIVKINDIEIIFFAAGFPDFRFSLHAKHPGKIKHKTNY